MKIFELFGSVALKDEASQGLEQLDRKAEQTGSKLGSFAKGAAAVGAAVGTAALAAGGYAYKVGSEFETSMAKASTLFGDVEVDTENLNKKILELSSSTGVSAAAIGDTLYNALSAGIPATEDMGEAMAFLEDSVKLAKAGFTDVDTAMGATAKVLNAYKMDVSETDKVHKVLMQTQNNGITTVGELGSVLANVTPTAAAMNVGFEQVGASLATMTAAGTPAAQATTQLNQLLAELGKSGTKAQLALMEATEGTEYAGMSFQDMMAEGVPLNEVVGLLGDQAEKSGLAMLDMFGSLEAGKAALSISGANAATFTKNLEAMGTTSDVVGDAFDKVSDTAQVRMEKLKASMQNVFIGLFNSLAPVIMDVMDLLLENMPMIQGLIERLAPVITSLLERLLPPLIQLIDKILPPLLEIFDLIAPFLFDIIDMLLPVFIDLLEMLLPPLIEIIKQLLPPLMEIIKLIIPYISTLIEMFKPFIDVLLFLIETVLPPLIDLITWLADIFYTTMTGALQALQPIMEGFALFLEGVFGAMFEWIAGGWRSTWNGIRNFFAGLGESLKNIVLSIANFFSGIWTSIRNFAINAWNGMVNGIRNIGSNMLSFVSSLPTKIIDFFKSLPGKLMEIGKNLIQGLWNGIANAGNWLRDKISGFFGGVVDSIKNFFGIGSPSKLFEGFGVNLDEGFVRGIEKETDAVEEAGKRLSEAAEAGVRNTDFTSSMPVPSTNVQRQPEGSPQTVRHEISGTLDVKTAGGEEMAEKVYHFVIDKIVQESRLAGVM